MSLISDHISHIRQQLPPSITLVCVSKFHPAEAIMAAYQVGERDFGESRVQELLSKYQLLPKDIRWHFIGHLQTNKVKAIVPFVHLIQSVDSDRLLLSIEQEAGRINRVVDVLLEVHVAREETKSGFSVSQLDQLVSQLEQHPLPHVRIRGIMGMATLTNDEAEIRRCFEQLYRLSQCLVPDQDEPIRSYGMSSDFPIALQMGANMVRIGTDIFGIRE